MTHILITGASSGIGEALALHYAKPGVTLSLTGRNPARTENTAQRCIVKGAAVSSVSLDVQNAEAMASWITERDEALPIDLLVANAGVSAGGGGDSESAEQTRLILSINVNGIFNTVFPVMGKMRARRRGHIALMSSIAGFRGLPSAPAYCASKAAIRIWGEALRASLARDGVNVSVICPGFVVSRITERNPFPMPFLMSAERGAEIIASGLAANKGRIAFPWQMAIMAWILRAFPDALLNKMTAKLPMKLTLPPQN